SGTYFITCCVKDRKCVFGRIISGNMQFSELGKIAQTYLEHIPKYFPNAVIQISVVMPNHIHAIIWIKSRNQNSAVTLNPLNTSDAPRQGGITGSSSPMLQDSLGRIVRWYKGRVAYECHKIDSRFQWQ